MGDVTIVYALIVVALVLFIWQKIPAVLVAVIVPLVLFFTGILTANQAMGGFGDPTVIFIAALFVVGAGLARRLQRACPDARRTLSHRGRHTPTARARHVAVCRSAP